jgi:hypothetical protein
MNRDDLVALAATDVTALTREQLEALARVGLHLLADVDAADLTPEYDYLGPGRRRNRNRHGEATRPGVKWLTPRELAEGAAKSCATILRQTQDPR